MSARRTEVSKELYATEKTYVESLRIVVEVYLKPLRSTNQIISKSDIKSIFSGNREIPCWFTCAEIEVILNYNSMLLKDLGDRMENWGTEQKLGDIFLRIVIRKCA